MKIKNWKAFQHYKCRTPPWVKLHKTLLDDPEWFCLPPAAAKTLIMLWLVASEDGGCLPPLAKLAFRLRISPKDISEIIPELNHWLEYDASELLAPCKQGAIADKEIEIEEEKEKDADASKNASKGSALSGGIGSIFLAPTQTEPTPAQTIEAEYFRRCREVLGRQAGGPLGAKLLKAKGRVELARASIETAATKFDPREYIGAVIRGKREGAYAPDGIS